MPKNQIEDYPREANLRLDAFADGQIRSKLWMCEELESNCALFGATPVIWVLACWYGILPFLILARGKIAPRLIRGFDIDSQAAQISNRINNRWEIESSRYMAYAEDVNRLSYADGRFGPPPNLVINTATEHFDSMDWWDRLPSRTAFALQGTNMKLDDHSHCSSTLEEFRANYTSASEIRYCGSLPFHYPDKSFERFMLIGVK